MNRFRDDDGGQVDGDASSAVAWGPAAGTPFATSMNAQPWMRGGVTPWHMWGNTQTIGPINATASDELEVASPGQLAKVAYKRPETWHWVFAARIVSVSQQSPGPGTTAEINVYFDLIIGQGRAQTVLRGFDHFRWVWAGLIPPPLDHVMWAMSTRTPALNYILETGVWVPDPATQRTIEQFEAQDIQLSCRVNFAQNGFIERPSAVVEVAAFLSPVVHVRPDWSMLDVPPESQFSGEETGGK